MNDLRSIPAYFMRGGTSKGLIFHKKDLLDHFEALWREYELSVS